MQGEYRGDFSRDTFDPMKQYSRVLMQQGRVLLDADWNEQTAILLHYLRTLATDLMGPHGGPKSPPGSTEPLNFAIQPFEKPTEHSKDFQIGKGHYYVRGILCDNQNITNYMALPYAEALNVNARYLVYLDVWERHLTPLDDDEMRETALGGPNTATRAQVQWQIKLVNYYWVKDGPGKDVEKPLLSVVLAPGETWRTWVDAHWVDWLAHWQPPNRGQLKAKAKADPTTATDPCNVPPEARYRGENQLYRVQIHQGGTIGDNDQPTFKWSRDNSAVEFAITSIATSSDSTTVTLADLGRDDYLSLHEGDWVEIVDDDYTLQNLAEPLLQVTTVDRVMALVMLKSKAVRTYDAAKHPRLRRWDQRAGDPKLGGLTLLEGAAAIKVAVNPDENWLMLEDGVQIQFQPGGNFRTGDYWLIPARAATGDVEWPGPVDNPTSQGPHGVDHAYAPLALIAVGADGTVTVNQDCRLLWELLGQPI